MLQLSVVLGCTITAVDDEREAALLAQRIQSRHEANLHLDHTAARVVWDVQFTRVEPLNIDPIHAGLFVATLFVGGCRSTSFRVVTAFLHSSYSVTSFASFTAFWMCWACGTFI